MEELAANRPVIATNEGGPSEIITDGKGGLLIPTDDIAAMTAAMEKMLLMDEDGIRGLRSGMQVRLPYFTGSAQAARQIDVYNKVMEMKRQKAGKTIGFDIAQ